MLTRLSETDFSPEISRLTKDFVGRQWVFDDLDCWLKKAEGRFFILTGEPGVGKSAIAAELIQRRRTHQDLAAFHFCMAGSIGTIEPDNVLLSIAAQLIQFFPDYAEALVNTIKPLHLSVDVKINIEKIKDSVVQGVVIENLHTQHPKKSFDIVLRQALSALPNPPEKPVFILIDSLDEAVTYNEEDNLVRLFSQVEDLPHWIRLVLTSRPDERRVLNHFKMLKPHLYHLDELSKKSLEDIHTYVEGRIEYDQIQSQLSKYEVSSEALLEKIADPSKGLSKGNFLYTKVLLDDIKSGGQPLDQESLAKLPKSLSEFYYTFLNRRVEAEWEGKYQIIFKILAVTKSPVIEEDLVNLVSESLAETELRQRLLVVRQFLDVEQNILNQKTYTLFHQSFQDFLVDNEKSGIFFCAPKDGHQQIVDYYWQYQEDPRSWQECDAYGLQFLTAHLLDLATLVKPPVKGRKYVERLHELLATEVDECNAWFVAKDKFGYTAGFIEDLELAWAKADEAYDREPGKSIGLQCRYALMKASIHSLSNIPTELLIALVKYPNPYWKAAKALDYVRQVPNMRARLESLVALARELPDSEPLKHQVLRSALHDIIKAQEVGLLDVVTLTRFYDKLPPDLLPKALDAAIKIKEEHYRAKALVSLGDKLPDLLPKALDAAIKIKEEHYRAEALAELGDKLTPELLPKALDATIKIKEEHYRAKALGVVRK